MYQDGFMIKKEDTFADKTLYILTGPTCSGKTDLGIAWAIKHDAEILSCDSLLVYKEMDVGTAKPTKEQMRCVPHHGIDLVSIDTPYNVKQYLDYALTTVASIFSRKKRALVVGGSGFYLKSFFAPVVDDYACDPNVLSAINDIEQTDGLQGLIAQLQTLNPGAELGSLIDIHNPVRVKNALMRCLCSGKTLPTLLNEFSQRKSAFTNEKRICVLSPPQDVLRERIQLRVQTILKNGLIEEVRMILGPLLQNPIARRAIGYRETIDYLQGRLPLTQLEDTIYRNTLGLVKKQRTWLRGRSDFERQWG